MAGIRDLLHNAQNDAAREMVVHPEGWDSSGPTLERQGSDLGMPMHPYGVVQKSSMMTHLSDRAGKICACRPQPRHSPWAARLWRPTGPVGVSNPEMSNHFMHTALGTTDLVTFFVALLNDLR